MAQRPVLAVFCLLDLNRPKDLGGNSWAADGQSLGSTSWIQNSMQTSQTPLSATFLSANVT